jgi:single stranded DNA-binding protein
MANDLNQIKLDGRLVEDPKIKTFENGARVAVARVANNRYYKGKEEADWKEKTGFFDVQAWNATADTLSAMKRGQAVHLEGALGQDSWTDTQNKAHSRVMIEVTKIEQREIKREKDEQRQESAYEL